MFARVSRFFQRHPLLRQALLWAVPALILGAALRVLLLSYLPIGYWGTDSKSYYDYAHRLLVEHEVDYGEKRRYVYPLLMVPVTLLPGTPLRWLAWLQHGLGLLSVLPLAYVVRKTMHLWKWWIIPVSVAYVLHPMFLWYEHELLGEVVFFAGFAWAFGGWVAWVMEKDPARARRLFWWFLLPMAFFLLTKPAGRFVLPGIAVGLVLVKAWRTLKWPQWSALAVLAAATFTVGSGRQGAWLLYTASFPLTQLDTPLHADYKADIRERVQKQAAQLDLHYLDSRAAMEFLDEPGKNGGSPLWAALDSKDDKKETKKRKLYMDLALEGIRARPLDYAYLAFQRLVASSNISAFEEARFQWDYYPNRFEKLYRDAQRQMATPNRYPSLTTAFGFKKGEPMPPYEEFRQRLARPDTWAQDVVLGLARAYQAVTDFVEFPRSPSKGSDAGREFSKVRVTWLGWYLLASLALSLVWWRTLGAWTILAAGYLCGVYLCALVQARFFLPAWLVFLPAFCAPLDFVWRRLVRRKE